MTDIAIRVEGLGKSYEYRPAPFFSGEWFRRLRRRYLGGVGETPGPDPNIFWALDDVNFTVRHGEIVGIIGRNGSGKSTLLKILSRITYPTTGRAVVHGRVGSLLEVGSGFHPELTGRENVFLNGAVLGMRRAEIKRRFDEIVEFAEIGPFIDTSVKFYSSGMYMRLAFAVAAHLESEILFCDEVLAVGDAAFQRKCLGRMETAARNGRTVLFVSHSDGAVKSLCSRAIWLESGRIREDGPAADTVGRYARQHSNFIQHATAADFPEDESLPIQVLRAELLPPAADDAIDREMRLRYIVRKPSDDVMMCIEVRNSSDGCVFYANDHQRGRHMERRLGIHECSLTLPFGLMAPDRYLISFGFSQPGHPPVHFPPVRLVHVRPPESWRPDVQRIETHNVPWPAVIYQPAVWKNHDGLADESRAA